MKRQSLEAQKEKERKILERKEEEETARRSEKILALERSLSEKQAGAGAEVREEEDEDRRSDEPGVARYPGGEQDDPEQVYHQLYDRNIALMGNVGFGMQPPRAQPVVVGPATTMAPAFVGEDLEGEDVDWGCADDIEDMPARRRAPPPPPGGDFARRPAGRSDDLQIETVDEQSAATAGPPSPSQYGRIERDPVTGKWSPVNTNEFVAARFGSEHIGVETG